MEAALKTVALPRTTWLRHRDTRQTAYMMLAAALLQWAFTAGAEPATFWDSLSYISYAHHLVEKHSLPFGLRTLGYPLLIAFCGLNLSTVVFVQKLLGIISVALLFRTAPARYRWPIAFAYAVSVDLVFMQITIYSEVLASFGLCLFAYGLTQAVIRQRWQWWVLAGLGATLAALTRPVLAATVPVTILILALARTDWRRIATFAAVPVLLLGSYSVHNRILFKVWRLGDGAGYGMLNYVGHPEIYGNLPPEQNRVKAVFAAAAARTGNAVVGWNAVVPELVAYSTDWDGESQHIAFAALTTTPKEYLNLWYATAKEYMSSYGVWYGLYKTEAVPQTCDQAQVSRGRYLLVRVIEFFWTLAQPLLSLAVIFLVPLSDRRPRTLVLWAVFVTISLVNTLIEPSPGQFRYRMPWTGIMLLLAGSVADSGWRLWRTTRHSLSKNDAE